MIMLDTNVISEIFRPQPEPRVLAWLEPLTDDVAITSITLAELLAFDADAAAEYAEVFVSRERAGLPISMADAQITAICRANRAVCATRKVKDFEATGVDVVNPWRE